MIDILISQLITLTALATSVERLVQIGKPIYLQLKNRIIKKEYKDITGYEKETLAVVISIGACILTQFKIEIPGINTPVMLQYILTGLITSLGSGLLHNLVNLVIAIKDSYKRS